MSDHTTVTKARSELAGLFSNGKTPDRPVEVAARRKLQTAKIERSIREAGDALAEYGIDALDPAQADYLGRLLADRLGAR